MSSTKTSASESSRPRKVLTQTRKQKKAFKQRKIPKALEKVVSNISPSLFNLLTSLVAFIYLRGQDGRFY